MAANGVGGSVYGYPNNTYGYYGYGNYSAYGDGYPIYEYGHWN